MTICEAPSRESFKKYLVILTALVLLIPMTTNMDTVTEISEEFVYALHSNFNSLSSGLPAIIVNAHCDNDISIGSAMASFFGFSSCNQGGRNWGYMSPVRRDKADSPGLMSASVGDLVLSMFLQSPPKLLLEFNRLAEIKLNLA